MLAGAALHVGSLAQVGLFGVAYIGMRTVGLIAGAHLGGWRGGADPMMRRVMGLALLPQAGVAIGMTLLAIQHFPDLKNTLLPLVLGSTVIFELIGPVVTRRVLVRMGEAEHN